jgi:hypothetical protein
VLTVSELRFYVVVAAVALTPHCSARRLPLIQVVSRHAVEPSVRRDQLVLCLQSLSVPVACRSFPPLLQLLLEHLKVDFDLTDGLLIVHLSPLLGGPLY